MQDEIFETLKEIFKETMPETDISEITAESSLKNDLGVDSIESMMIAMLIEERYNFKFDDSLDFEKVSDICDYIQNKIS